jgi:hypothetical protein
MSSARLLRAVRAERAELDRERGRLALRRDELRAQLERLEAQLGELDERSGLLDRLAPRAPVALAPDPPPALMAPAAARPATALRGTAIREAAVRVLSERPEGAGPVHYRRWHELLGEAGLAVAGKDPLAVFLTQVSRSPVVRRAGAPGHYELDHDGPKRLRQRLAALQEQLRAAAGGPRGRREELAAQVGRTERELEEAERSLAPADGGRERAA